MGSGVHMTELAAFAAEIQAFVEESRHEMLSMLSEVVEIDSPSEHPAGIDRVADVFCEHLRAAGLKARRVPTPGFGDHVIADGGPAEGPRVLLVGHMDTVFPVGSGWGFSVDSTRAYGPGVIDMKSGDCVAVWALRALAATRGLPLPVRVLFNSEEEQGSPYMNRLLPDICADVDFAFCMEPAEPTGEIITTRKGAGVYKATVHGRAAHAGKQPESGINANRELACLILAAEELADPHLGTTVNTGYVHGGEAAAIVAKHAEAHFDLRVPTPAEQQRLERGIPALADAARLVPGAKVEIGGHFHRPPMPMLPGSDVLVQTLTDAAAAAGGQAVFGASGAVSDGNLTVAAGVPTIDGMGAVGGREHSTDEYMELESYFERTVWLAVALHLLAQRAGVQEQAETIEGPVGG